MLNVVLKMNVHGGPLALMQDFHVEGVMLEPISPHTDKEYLVHSSPQS